MKLPSIVLALSLAMPFAAEASGFGWFSAVVKWGDVKEVRDRGLATAEDLLSENKDSEKLKRHLQILVDNELQNRFCHPAPGDGYSLNPRNEEFLSRNFVAWGASQQRARKVQDSIFYLFQDPPRLVKISNDKRYIRDRDLWFVIDPPSVSKYLEEMRAFNDAVKAPDPYRLLSRFLEGVLLIANSDRHADKSEAEKYELESAIFVCGHD